MQVVVDNNLPRSLARLLESSGISAVHVFDAGLADAPDQALRERLADRSIVLLSRDADFWAGSPAGWAVVWLALHNPTLAELKGPVCRRLVAIIPTLRPGQRVLFAADQIRVFQHSPGRTGGR